MNAESAVSITVGSKVTYLGEVATVIHVWGDLVNVRFDRKVRNHSQQFDVYVSSLTLVR